MISSSGSLQQAGDEGARAGVAAAERRAVAPKNEELLKSQSSDLYEEYITGGWAHTSPVEAGGLMMRLPLMMMVMAPTTRRDARSPCP